MADRPAGRRTNDQAVRHSLKARNTTRLDANDNIASLADSVSTSIKLAPWLETRLSKWLLLARAILETIWMWQQPHYAYRELNHDKKEIRLLILEPGTGKEVVKATFKQAFLTDDTLPQYETVSYSWGDPTERSTISLHGKILSVPASSESALRRMRYPNKIRVLWIDAICINQDDVRERGHQVAIMAKVYGGTWRNLIWLGEDSHSTAAALDSIEQLNDEFRRDTDNFTNVFNTLYASPTIVKSSSKQVLARIDRKALAQFYYRPWFSRLWVVQEAALAPQNLCFCGRYTIALEPVLRAARWLRYKSGSGHGVDYASYENCSVVFTYADGDHGLFAGSGSPLKPRMLDLLVNLRIFGASEPKDHVFALLGLWQKHHPDQILPASLAPDYISPLSTVLRRATQFAMLEWGSLEPLREVSHRLCESEIPGLPTWVPRWHESINTSLDAYGLAYNNDEPLEADVLMDFEEEGVLIVKGTILDIVQSDPLSAPPELLRDAQVMLAFFGQVESLLAQDVSANSTRRNEILSEFARTGESQARDLETDLYRGWISFLKEKGKWCKPGRNCPSTDDFQSLYLVQASLLRVSHNRRFFITASKHFGFGPQKMRTGTVLAVLAGLDVPVILRPSNLHPGDHEFVGDAAVHGLMRGEAVHKLRAEGKTHTRIRLR